MRLATLLTWRLENSFTPLLVTLLVFQGAFPVVYNSRAASLALTTLMLVAAIPAVQPSPRLRMAATLGLLVVVVSRVAVLRLDTLPWGYAVSALLLSAAYVAFIAGSVLAAILRRTRVTANTVVGALCVYLLMAHVFALVYASIETASPRSFAGLEPGAGDGRDHSHLHEFLYFSIITMTTLGFGDMLAITPAARALVMLEAMSGQFFVAVFVARLVGAWSSTQDPAGADNDD